MPGEADRLKKEVEELRTEHAGQKRALEVAANGLTSESQRRKKAEARVAELEELNAAFKEELEAWHSANGRARAALKEEREMRATRLRLGLGGPVTYVDPDQRAWDELRARLTALEDQVKRLAAAYDSWGLMRDNQTSVLTTLSRQVELLLTEEKRRRWWQR